MAWYRTGGGSSEMELVYAAYKTGTTANSYTFTNNYKNVIAIGSMYRTSGSGLAATQRPTATLASGTSSDLYDSGVMSSSYRLVVMECKNVKSGDVIQIATPNSNFYGSLTILAN